MIELMFLTLRATVWINTAAFEDALLHEIVLDLFDIS